MSGFWSDGFWSGGFWSSGFWSGGAAQVAGFAPPATERWQPPDDEAFRLRAVNDQVLVLAATAFVELFMGRNRT